MEPSRKSHAKLNRVHFCGAMPYDITENVATHSSRLQPSINCIPQLQVLNVWLFWYPSCSTSRQQNKFQYFQRGIIKRCEPDYLPFNKPRLLKPRSKLPYHGLLCPKKIFNTKLSSLAQNVMNLWQKNPLEAPPDVISDTEIYSMCSVTTGNEWVWTPQSPQMFWTTFVKLRSSKPLTFFSLIYWIPCMVKSLYYDFFRLLSNFLWPLPLLLSWLHHVSTMYQWIHTLQRVHKFC